MKTDDSSLALPEPALRHDNDTEQALSIANDARKQWNDSRRDEVQSNQLLTTDEVQDAMATDIFNAVMAHLEGVPRPIQERVIAKFHAVNLPKRMTAR